MPPTEQERLSHILEAARDAMSFVANKSREDLKNDRLLQHALIHCIEVVGEASAHVSTQTRLSLPAVPWPLIRKMRNFLAHVYFAVNHDILWDTVVDDLPPLIAALENAVPEAADPMT